jgi:hypothetical protein
MQWPKKKNKDKMTNNGLQNNAQKTNNAILAHIHFHSKRPHTITKMNANIHMHSTI